MRNKENGIILDENTISEFDYIIGSDDPLIIPENTNTDKYFYNQANKRTPSTKRSCGLFASMGCISDLTGYEFTESDIAEINQLAIDKFGLSIPGGMYMSKAIDCLRTRWNSKNTPDNQLISFRTTIGSETYADGLKKGHSFAVGYKTSVEYHKDSQDDGIVTGEDFEKGGGHLVRSNFSDSILIDDNYSGGKKYNTYINNKISTLKAKGVYFPSAYIFLYDKTMEEQILDNIDLAGAKAEYLLGTWSGNNPREMMSRQEVMQVINNLRKDLQK